MKIRPTTRIPSRDFEYVSNIGFRLRVYGHFWALKISYKRRKKLRNSTGYLPGYQLRDNPVVLEECVLSEAMCFSGASSMMRGLG